MTPEEAQKVGAICASADGYCVVCAGELAEQLQKVFPEFNWQKLCELEDDDEEEKT